MEPDEGTYKWGITTSQAYFPKDFGGEFDNDYTITEWLTQYSETRMPPMCGGSSEECSSPEKMV